MIDYKVYRANFLFIWFCANGAYFVTVLRLGEAGDEYEVNDGSFSVLDGFSMDLASVVIFKVVFAILYVIKWQCRYLRKEQYKVTEYNLERTFKALKKGKEDAESSDDVEDKKFLQEVTEKRGRSIKHKSRHLFEAGGRRKLSKGEMLT